MLSIIPSLLVLILALLPPSNAQNNNYVPGWAGEIGGGTIAIIIIAILAVLSFLVYFTRLRNERASRARQAQASLVPSASLSMLPGVGGHRQIFGVRDGGDDSLGAGYRSSVYDENYPYNETPTSPPQRQGQGVRVPRRTLRVQEANVDGEELPMYTKEALPLDNPPLSLSLPSVPPPMYEPS